MQWLYEGTEFTSEHANGYKAFVYIITNTANGKQYIGKKRFQFMRTKKLKSHKRKIREFKESDWNDYYGSSEALAKDIVRFGKDSFKREILHLCKTNAVATYWELYEQLNRHVLLNPVQFYNNYVGARIHRNHVYGKDL